MRAFLIFTILTTSLSFLTPRYYKPSFYNINRSVPLPTNTDSELLPSSENTEWENGEVPWDIDNLKNITLQPIQKKPTPFNGGYDPTHLFHVVIDW